ncbi:MAG: hypothetical protein FWG30_09635 [Eubacteriaceae bacterium]|nr:hypothetical protein [Eubacteriaceae bacterium]
MERTPKEIHLGLANGLIPDSVPISRFGNPDSPTAAVGAMELQWGDCSFMFAGGEPRTAWDDIWGVPHVANPETGYAGIPKPGVYILEDVSKWDKVVKFPDIDTNIDWEAKAKADLANIDRSQKAVSTMCGFMPFQQLMALMGFSEGLSALYEEPESVKELLNYMADYFVPILENTVEHYQPDLISLLDDTASKYAPFFSVGMYQEFFRPIYERLTAKAVERGAYIDFHNCGRCEDFVPDMIDFGVRYWNPAQTENDLVKIKSEHKNFVISGGWDFVPEGEVTEEQVRQSVRDTIDKYAPGGSYIFGGGFLGTADEREKAMQINGWVSDEAQIYGKDYYKKRGESNI